MDRERWLGPGKFKQHNQGKHRQGGDSSVDLKEARDEDTWGSVLGIGMGDGKSPELGTSCHSRGTGPRGQGS